MMRRMLNASIPMQNEAVGGKKAARQAFKVHFGGQLFDDAPIGVRFVFRKKQLLAFFRSSFDHFKDDRVRQLLAFQSDIRFPDPDCLTFAS